MILLGFKAKPIHLDLEGRNHPGRTLLNRRIIGVFEIIQLKITYDTLNENEMNWIVEQGKGKWATRFFVIISDTRMNYVMLMSGSHDQAC